LLARVKELLKVVNAGSDAFPEILKGILFEKDESGLNALHHAVRSGNKLAVQWCMQNGAVAYPNDYEWCIESGGIAGSDAQHDDIVMTSESRQKFMTEHEGQTLAYSWYEFEQPDFIMEQIVEDVGNIKSLIPDGASKMTLATLWEYV
jgi:hypothetical protein